MKIKIVLLLTILLASGCATKKSSKDQGIEVFPASKIQWEKLNPARGDKSPQAGTLWGNRKSDVETGFLVKFVDGFSSPPHIHNTSYRGIVIKGLVHNDDPKAATMWMPKGSFWTQPAGEAHITSAKGKQNIAFIEIDKGPYLVKPVSKAFDNGERPYNIHATNIVWQQTGTANLAPLWTNKQGQVTGTLVSYKGSIKIQSPRARVVVISGKLRRNSELPPGSLITIKDSSLRASCASKSGCILYLQSHLGLELEGKKLNL